MNTRQYFCRILEYRAFGVTFLIGLIVLTRVVFRSHLLYDVDSVNFALALRRFDPTVHQPHPPGYFLYVCLGRLLNSIIHDPNIALVWISIVASAAAAGAIYALTNAWFGRRAAALSLLLFLFSPLCWFHGTVALTYIVEACFSAVVGYCCWRIQGGHRRWVLAASVFLGLPRVSGPLRFVFLLPLWAFSLRRSSPRWICMGCLVARVDALGVVRPDGGERWRIRGLCGCATAPLDSGSGPGDHTHRAPGHVPGRGLTIVWIYVLCFGVAAPLIFWIARTRSSREPRKAAVHDVWLAPGVLFFTFGFLLFVNSGYLLFLSPPLFAWLAGVLDRLYERAAAHA